MVLALVVAIIAVNLAGQTAARMWLEDLDERLLDAGAGTNAALITLEREHLEAFRAIGFSQGFAADLEALDVRAIESRITPIDANNGIPMIDVIDVQGRVIFAFRADGALQPIYRERLGVDVVASALAGERDEYGERFTELIATEEGPLLATAGPVRDEADGSRIVGSLLVMTPLHELLGQAKNLHGADLTVYADDRGEPLATTTPVRPRSLSTDELEVLAHPEGFPEASAFDIGGKRQREQIGGLIVRHRLGALLGASMPDRSREVANRVMLLAGLGLLAMSILVASSVHAWLRDREVAT